jgi:hypothetical protein
MNDPKSAKKKYQKPALKSEKIGEGTLTAGGPGPAPAPTCNGMPGSGKKDTPAAPCTILMS